MLLVFRQMCLETRAADRGMGWSEDPDNTFYGFINETINATDAH